MNPGQMVTKVNFIVFLSLWGMNILELGNICASTGNQITKYQSQHFYSIHFDGQR